VPFSLANRKRGVTEHGHLLHAIEQGTTLMLGGKGAKLQPHLSQERRAGSRMLNHMPLKIVWSWLGHSTWPQETKEKPIRPESIFTMTSCVDFRNGPMRVFFPRAAPQTYFGAPFPNDRERLLGRIVLITHGLISCTRQTKGSIRKTYKGFVLNGLACGFIPKMGFVCRDGTVVSK
jgi:hypothetical protein